MKIVEGASKIENIKENLTKYTRALFWNFVINIARLF